MLKGDTMFDLAWTRNLGIFHKDADDVIVFILMCFRLSTRRRYVCVFIWIHFRERFQIDAVSSKMLSVLMWTEALNVSKYEHVITKTFSVFVHLQVGTFNRYFSQNVRRRKRKPNDPQNRVKSKSETFFLSHRRWYFCPRCIRSLL